MPYHQSPQLVPQHVPYRQHHFMHYFSQPTMNQQNRHQHYHQQQYQGCDVPSLNLASRMPVSSATRQHASREQHNNKGGHRCNDNQDLEGPKKKTHTHSEKKTHSFRELTDDLRWDFLRELVDLEFAKIEPMIGNEKRMDKKTIAENPLECRNLLLLSAASTANNSPEGRPIEPSTYMPSIHAPAHDKHALAPKLTAVKPREPTVLMHRVLFAFF
jgi:hypothetical protein